MNDMDVYETANRLRNIQQLLDTAGDLLNELTSSSYHAYPKSDGLLLEDLMKHNVEPWDVAKILHGLS